MNYLAITKDDMINGEGLRVVLWVAGCGHKCQNCQNPHSWNENSGVSFTEETKQELFKELEKDYISGITFSGGDPLYINNRETVTRLCKEIKGKFPNKNIWLYTGYVYGEVQDLEIMKYIDVLIDGPYIESKRDIELEWRGSSNQRIIRIKEL